MSYMAIARRQTLIQLDDASIAALDQRAAASGRSRSDLVREAIDLLLGAGDAAAIDAAIVAGYEKVPPPNSTRGPSTAPSRRSGPSPGSAQRDLVGRPPGRRATALPRPHPTGRDPRPERCSPCPPLAPCGRSQGGRTGRTRRHAGAVRPLARQSDPRPEGALPHADYPPVGAADERGLPSARARVGLWLILAVRLAMRTSRARVAARVGRATP
jgi:Ribbon-helix-helix protein, copG family